MSKALFVLLFVLPLSLFGQDKEARKWGILPVPAFATTPETGWYVGAVGLFTYNPQLADNTRTSNGTLEFNYTQNRQWIFSADWNIWTPGNASNGLGEIQWMLFPENYWGIGGGTQPEQEERYQGRRLEVDQQWLWQLRENLYAGPAYRLQYMYDLKFDNDGELAEGTITGTDGGTSSGLGYRIAWDSRQNPINPKQGSLLAIEQTAFGSALGSRYTFTRTAIEGRKYISLFGKHILAMQGLAWLQSGDPPFRMMNLLGGDQRMRGYYRGRYRDRQYVMGQVEYRAPVWWRLGFTAFAGVGNVAPTLATLNDTPWKPSTGLGVRFLTDKQEDINLRLDFAWGRDTFEFYLAFGEAF